jgi:DNA polymerase elongation subunit (family B)
MITKCWEEFRNLLGRIKSIPSNLIEKKMSSGAYGDNHWKLLPMSGRLVFDPIVHLKREFKLSEYNLKAVSEYFLSIKLGPDPLSTTQGSRVVRVNHPKHGLSVDSVIHFSGIDTPDIVDTGNESFYVFAGWTYEELHGDQILQSGLHVVSRVLSADSYEIEMSRPASTTVNGGGGRLVKVFETKHEMNFPEMFRAFREQDLEKLRKVALYCIQDTILPQKILDKLCILPNLFERGQQIKVYSQLGKSALETGWAVPTVRKLKDAVIDEDIEKEKKKEDEGYEGGVVLTPLVDFYDEPVGVPDFNSLYPSWVIDGNFCFTTLVKNPAYDNLPGVQYNRVQISETKTNVFAMNYNGLLPGLLVYLLQTRNKRKKMMEDATDPLGRMIHNGAQLALKVSANSAYGFTGVKPEKSLLPCVAIAESTTKCGRDGTLLARDFAENMDNFRDIMQCTTHFPLYYTYLVKNTANGKCFHMTGKKLLDAFRVSLDSNLLPSVDPSDKNQTLWQYLPEEQDEPVVKVDKGTLEVWSTEDFSRVIGFSRVKRPFIEGDLIRVHTEKGQTPSMNHYNEGERFCKVVYGDTDSIFCLIGSKHLKTQAQKVAYCGIACALISYRVTNFLRARNTFRKPSEQWMTLGYEKTYRYWILFSKKRYIGEMTEFDPYKFTDDEKGVAKKRRDFCSFVKENYSKISKAIFNNDEYVSRQQP